MLLRVFDAQYSEAVIINFSLSMVFFIRIFFIFDLLVYSQRMIRMRRVRDFITNLSSRKASCHAGILYYSMEFMDFYRNP